MQTLKKYLSPRTVCELILLLIIGILFIKTPNAEEEKVLNWYHNKKTYVETAEVLNSLTKANDDIESVMPLLPAETF